jgi:hypothetical protein
VNASSLDCQATGSKRVGGSGASLRPFAVNGSALACTLGKLPSFAPLRLAPGSPAPPPPLPSAALLSLSCTARMESNGTSRTVAEGLEPLTSFDPLSLTRCRLADPAFSRVLNVTALRCTAWTTPSPVDVPASASGVDTFASCSRFLPPQPQRAAAANAAPAANATLAGWGPTLLARLT